MFDVVDEKNIRLTVLVSDAVNFRNGGQDNDG